MDHPIEYEWELQQELIEELRAEREEYDRKVLEGELPLPDCMKD